MASPERPLEERSFGIDGFEYRDTEYVLGNSLVFDSELTISTDTLTADQLTAYRKFRERAMRNAQSGRYYPKANAELIDLGSRKIALLNQLKGL